MVHLWSLSARPPAITYQGVFHSMREFLRRVVLAFSNWSFIGLAHDDANCPPTHLQSAQLLFPDRTYISVILLLTFRPHVASDTSSHHIVKVTLCYGFHKGLKYVGNCTTFWNVVCHMFLWHVANNTEKIGMGNTTVKVINYIQHMCYPHIM